MSKYLECFPKIISNLCENHLFSRFLFTFCVVISNVTPFFVNATSLTLDRSGQSQNNEINNSFHDSNRAFRSLSNSTNPFYVEYPVTNNLTLDDYDYIQTQLRLIDIEPLLNEIYYQDTHDKFSFDHFKGRCTTGLRLNLLDPQNCFLPQRELVKIGKGSDMCVVCYTSFNSNYPDCLKTIPTALEKLGFNGYFFFQLGGFPNPSEIDIRYAGVPYSFKIPMMLEAKKLGFTKVLWIDSALLPIKDPTPFFEWINKTGACWSIVKNYPEGKKFVFESTKRIMKELTGTDILMRAEKYYTWGGLFGLDLSTKKTGLFIKLYLDFVKLGVPFLNGSPDEIVMTAILGMPAFKSWHGHPYPGTGVVQGATLKERIKISKSMGFYFYYRLHNENVIASEYEEIFNELYP